MASVKFLNVTPDNIMSSGQQVDRIYSSGTLVWEHSTAPTYPEVTIGTQTWMSVNLDIDDGLGGIYAYNNDEANVTTYGRLYTWDAAMRVAANIDGWHLPSDAEWQTLVDYLGGASVAGGKLKETGTTHWTSPNIGATNETSFTGMAGGYYTNGTFYNTGYNGYWWSAMEFSVTAAWYRYMYNDYSSVGRYNSNKGWGFSVRLIKDYSHTPNITLVGDNPVTISVGDTYTDAGATAYDTRYGDITSDIVVVVNNVNTSVAGTYTVTYNITTEDGYTAEEVVRTVVVELALPQQNWEEVTIGNQTWMKYNLVIDDGQGGIYSYNNDIANAHVYGYLYTWDAAVRVAANIDGWHLPSLAEWDILINYLGGINVAGGKLKEAGTTHWASPNTGATDEYGFTALPGGLRFNSGTFYHVGLLGYWRSATEISTNNAWHCNMDYNYSVVGINNSNKELGFSVRLIKDYPTYTLTVTNGTGDGTYVENTVVEIAADVPASGYQFKEWTGDIQYLASTTSSTTNVTMPAGDISVTATYELIPAETVTIGGEEYETVTIGTQTWLKRNLHFDDSVGGIYSYNNDIQISDVYGYLYTWDAAVRVAASIDGWHLPSDAEWQTLIGYLGGNSVTGGKLKETGTTHWNSPNTGATNETGFTAFGGGRRSPTGVYSLIKQSGIFWSSKQTTLDTTDGTHLSYNNTAFGVYTTFKATCLSVRLIKNTP